MVNGWAKERYVYFTAVFSRPFNECSILSDGKRVFYNGYRFRSKYECAGKNLQFFANFKTKKDEQILVKVAISAVSTNNAAKNMNAELSHWNFEQLVRETSSKWNKELGKVQVEGTREQKETFYTALYHAFLTPVLYQDVNGEYPDLIRISARLKDLLTMLFSPFGIRIEQSTRFFASCNPNVMGI